MKRVIGFALFFMAIGILLSYLISGFVEFLVITLMLLLAYILFCK